MINIFVDIVGFWYSNRNFKLPSQIALLIASGDGS